jgi:hypothetical protein
MYSLTFIDETTRSLLKDGTNLNTKKFVGSSLSVNTAVKSLIIINNIVKEPRKILALRFCKAMFHPHSIQLIHYLISWTSISLTRKKLFMAPKFSYPREMVF